jgi:hypothetical protein
LYTEISDVHQEQFPREVGKFVTKQSLLVKNIDIYEIGKIFTDHLLFGNEKYAEEPEIVLDL